MVVRRFKLKVFSVNGRLRARLEDANGRFEYGEWWIESRGHRRYKPFKPMHPLALAIISKLPLEEQKKIAEFLLTAEDGDTYEFQI